MIVQLVIKKQTGGRLSVFVLPVPMTDKRNMEAHSHVAPLFVFGCCIRYSPSFTHLCVCPDRPGGKGNERKEKCEEKMKENPKWVSKR
jgi:hypothetical protein